MNQLFRGLGRSRSTLLAGGRAFSSSKSASALGVGAPNLITQQNSVVPTPINLPFGASHHCFPNDGHVPSRYLSSVSAQTATVQSDGDASQDESDVKRKPTPLEWANLEEKTPGHSIFFLQTYGAKNGRKYGNQIYQSDFIQLCESSRPGKQKDAKVIATALKTFKRNNAFILEIDGAWAAVSGMMRSMKPTWKEQDGRPTVRAAVFVLQQFLDESTGLYFATETRTINYLLKELHQGLESMEKNGFNMRVDKSSSEDGAEAEDDTEAKEELSADEKLVSDALQVTGDVVKLLIKRKSRPESDMKKRAKRKYLKHLKVSSGPYRSTEIGATKISIMLGGSVAAQEIVNTISDAWWTRSIDETVLNLVREAKEQEDKVLAEAAALEKEANALEEAAAADDEAMGEEVDDEKSSAADDDQVDHGEKEDSQEEVQSEEGKKD